MSLPRSSITAIKSNLNVAISAKDPHAIASAVDLPPLVKSAGDNDASLASQPPPSPHAEYLKIDGVDWSNVLNPLLDAHLAIQLVRVIFSFKIAYSEMMCTKRCSSYHVSHTHLLEYYIVNPEGFVSSIRSSILSSLSYQPRPGIVERELAHPGTACGVPKYTSSGGLGRWRAKRGE